MVRPRSRVLFRAVRGLQQRLIELSRRARRSSVSHSKPAVFMSTRDGVNDEDSLPVAVGSHSHLNWAFSEPGSYEVQWQASGALALGPTIESAPVILRFLVKEAATAPFLTAALVNIGSEIQISWESTAEAVYQLQSRESLGAGDWSNEGESIPGDGGRRSISLPVQPVTLKVFRLLEAGH